MSYISKFKYNTPYSNVDIAEMMSIVVSEGVMPLADSPNGILKNLVGEGVTDYSERCTVSLAETVVTIGKGCVIMPDGSYILITEPEQLTLPTESEKCYVYIEEIETGNNVPKCSVALPENDDTYVMLAEIEGGSVTDCRIWCQAKIPLKASSRVTQALSVSYSVPRNQPDFVLAKQTPLSNRGFVKILIFSEYESLGVWNRATGAFTYTYKNSSGDFKNGTDDSEMVLRTDSVTTHKLKFDVTGDMLNVYIYAHTQHDGTSNLSGSFNIELI